MNFSIKKSILSMVTASFLASSVTLMASNTAHASQAGNITGYTGNITGYVWADKNANTKVDRGEARIAARSVSLVNSKGKVVSTTKTNKNGQYRFSRVSSGKYSVRVSSSGFTHSTVAGGYRKKAAARNRVFQANNVTVKRGTVGVNFGLWSNVPKMPKGSVYIPRIKNTTSFDYRYGGIDKKGNLAVPNTVKYVQYKYGAKPGDKTGTVVIAGHVNSVDGKKTPGPLKKAYSNMRKGDKLYVRDAKGNVYAYKLVRKIATKKTNLNKAYFTRRGNPKLVAFTCGGRFVKGHSVDNYILEFVPTSL